jgi:histidine triad (HIT) family protein
MHTDPDCVFCKIIAGQIPSKKAYEDEHVLAFHDINPWAPVHVLLIPNVGPEHQEVLGRILVLAPRLMKDLGVTNGFRTVINTGADGGQEVWHLHVHAYGGPRPWKKG